MCVCSHTLQGSHAHSHNYKANLDSPIMLSHMFLDGGRKLESLAKSHANMGGVQIPHRKDPYKYMEWIIIGSPDIWAKTKILVNKCKTKQVLIVRLRTWAEYLMYWTLFSMKNPLVVHFLISVFRTWEYSVWRRRTWMMPFPAGSRHRITLLKVSMFLKICPISQMHSYCSLLFFHRWKQMAGVCLCCVSVPEAEVWAEEFDLNAVRLCFQASITLPNSQLYSLQPVVSQPIYDNSEFLSYGNWAVTADRLMHSLTHPNALQGRVVPWPNR